MFIFLFFLHINFTCQLLILVFFPFFIFFSHSSCTLFPTDKPPPRTSAGAYSSSTRTRCTKLKLKLMLKRRGMSLVSKPWTRPLRRRCYVDLTDVTATSPFLRYRWSFHRKENGGMKCAGPLVSAGPLAASV